MRDLHHLNSCGAGMVFAALINGDADYSGHGGTFGNGSETRMYFLLGAGDGHGDADNADSTRHTNEHMGSL